MLGSRLRWRTCTAGELETVVARLAGWPCPVGGEVRHMFALAAIEEHGSDPVRLVSDNGRWAAAIVFPGRLVVPCGDAAAIAEAGMPTRRWRLTVGDVAAVDALLGDAAGAPDLNVHHQRYLVVEPQRVPGHDELPDPGVRPAVPDDLPALTELALQLHVDDRFGPRPGKAGARGYAQRIGGAITRGSVFCVGPVGEPIAKLERSVASRRWGVQLAGIVVDRDHRGSGIGTGLVTEAVRAALRDAPRRPVSLHVRADNPAALAAYDRAGFVDREQWRLAVRP